MEDGSQLDVGLTALDFVGQREKEPRKPAVDFNRFYEPPRRNDDEKDEEKEYQLQGYTNKKHMRRGESEVQFR